ncbi:hypothetical protein FBZ89_109215 [Nitrospirillum amazonense]|uniref:Secreted protein n=1 Tax=Nitrospirillum amazonense TaxID=28077 RepID=A0A560FB32_9PROT|nr:hypothetical protein [Nitrospirillum amazonense]TWB18829.1 hypothetical protein FBZ89_109215 [Nitrospirillum amazonense]
MTRALIAVVLAAGTSLFALTGAGQAEPSSAAPAGRYQLLYTGKFTNQVAEVYRIDTQTGQRWFLAEGTHWVPADPVAPGHYQVLSTGFTRNGESEVLMINAETGETWRRKGNDWIRIPFPG